MDEHGRRDPTGGEQPILRAAGHQPASARPRPDERLPCREAIRTARPQATPRSASVRSAAFVTVMAFSDGATAASNANRTISDATARTLSRRQNQSVQPRKRPAKTAATAGTSIQKMSTASQRPKTRALAISALRVVIVFSRFEVSAIRRAKESRRSVVTSRPRPPRAVRPGERSPQPRDQEEQERGEADRGE